MIECPSCALEVNKDHDTCPYCGYEFPKSSSGMKAFAWLFVLLLLWPLYELVMFLLSRF